MFNWLMDKTVGKVVDGVVDTIDNLHTSDEEKEELKLKFKELELKLEEQYLKKEEEVSKRWESDNKSDSWLPKNIRPLTLVYLLLLLTSFAFTDGNIGEFKINPAYIDLFQALAITAFGGYFVSRGFEKYTNLKQK